MKMVIKEYQNWNHETIIHGTITVDFKRGVFTDGDCALFAMIEAYFNDGMCGESTYKSLLLSGTDKKEARKMAMWNAGIFAQHSQSPSYKLTKPFTHVSEFKALISCLGMYSNDLNDVVMPLSLWELSPTEEKDPRLKIVY
jgi:hypothetical protein